MKKKSIIAILIIAFCFSGHSQETAVKNDSIVTSVEEHIYSINLTRKGAKKVFQQIKTLAEQGDVNAMCLLGILYKDGIGTKLNFNKARKQFKNAYRLGSDKAAYSLGYLYLKGLGNAPQDYSKAIGWIRKSEYPMAKHWLAKCHYYGFGMPINQAKGMELLHENPIGNSKVLLSKWEYEMKSSKPNSDSSTVSRSPGNAITATADDENVLGSDIEVFGNGIAGIWEGEWRFLDWSSERIMRSVPITLEISENGTGMLDCSIELDGKVFTGSIIQSGNELIFPDLIVALKENHIDHISDLVLDYQLTSFAFKLEETDNGQYMKGNMESNIIKWSEPAAPSKLLLRRKSRALSNEVIDALSVQGKHFIKVYPNPFEENLLLHYTLSKDSDVFIQLYDYHRPSRILKTMKRKQKKGERVMALDGLSSLKKGPYIINMNVGADRYTRIVVRK